MNDNSIIDDLTDAVERNDLRDVRLVLPRLAPKADNPIKRRAIAGLMTVAQTNDLSGLRFAARAVVEAFSGR